MAKGFRVVVEEVVVEGVVKLNNSRMGYGLRGWDTPSRTTGGVKFLILLLHLTHLPLLLSESRRRETEIHLSEDYGLRGYDDRNGHDLIFTLRRYEEGGGGVFRVLKTLTGTRVLY